MNHSTGKTPFEVIYDNPQHTSELVPLPRIPEMSIAANHMAEKIADILANTKKALEESNVKYKAKADMHMCLKAFKVMESWFCMEISLSKDIIRF